ncbi:hypothetical protein VB005_10235 [Metarhizium brunneum]
MSQESADATRRAIVELANLPSCAADCYSPLAASGNLYSCHAVSNSESLQGCLLGACPLPEAIFARNATEIACETPVRDTSAPFLVINIVLGLITAAVIVMRLAYRFFFSRRNGRLDIDDGLILLASPVAIASLTTLLAGLWKHGIGKDVWGLSSEEVVTFGLFLYVMEMLYLTLLTLVKLTLSVFYLEIFPSSVIRKLLLGTVVFHVLFGVGFVCKTIFQCTPVEYSWLRYDAGNAATTHGHCVKIHVSAYVNAAVNVATDFWLIGIPITQLHRLKLHWKKKIGASFMFMTGLLVTVISILRLNTLKDYAKTTNPTYDQYSVTLWSAVEVNIGLICTCLPSIRLILLRIWPRVFGMTSIASSHGNSQKASYREPSRYLYKSPVNNAEHELDATARLTEPADVVRTATRSTWSGEPERDHGGYMQFDYQESPRAKSQL